MTRPFLDTNILIYAVSLDDRAVVARSLLEQPFIISVQVLNEFANVASRKLKMPWPEIVEALNVFRELSEDILPLDIALHDDALRLSQRYGYTIYDCLIIAAALKARCRSLISEDMQAGQRLDGIDIINPFSD